MLGTILRLLRGNMSLFIGSGAIPEYIINQAKRAQGKLPVLPASGMRRGCLRPWNQGWPALGLKRGAKNKIGKAVTKGGAIN